MRQAISLLVITLAVLYLAGHILWSFFNPLSAVHRVLVGG
jgi:hypothetical protein